MKQITNLRPHPEGRPESGPAKGPLKAHHHSLKLMGCKFVLTAAHQDPQVAWDGIRAGIAEIDRIEQLISSWIPGSYTDRINAAAGKAPVQVPRELFDLIARSNRVSQLTGGAFDISGTLSRKYWNFNGEESNYLSLDRIKELRDLMDYRLIELDEENCTVYLRKAGMMIGFGGIGKGYAAWRACKVMEALGVQSGLINASGDLMAWGKPPGEESWEVMVRDPEERDKPLLSLRIPEGSVVTSGNYENYTLVDGKRLSHIIDPRTGRPVEALKCVSVVCPNPELADALATAISVMGVQEGLEMVNRLRGIECLIIDHANQCYYSEHLQSFEHAIQTV